MLRSMHLIFLLLAVVLVASLQDPSEPVNPEDGLPPKNVNDLDADAYSWGYSRPWRYNNWNGGWGRSGGWRSGGWGWGGRGWTGRGGGWW